MAMFTQNCKKWIFKATVYSPNSVVQETSTYSKMFPWINHTCILEHLFSTELIFKKRSHVLWQFWPKTNALSSQPSNHQVSARKRAPVQQKGFPWTIWFWNIFSSTSLFWKTVPHFMAMLTQSCKKTYSRQPFTRQNSVVQETSTYSKMFPWINHTCILEHLFLSALIFKKRSHVLWQCSLKAAKKHIQADRLLTKFRGARNIHLQQNVPLDQPYMHFGTFVLYRVDFQKTVPRFMAMLAQDQCTFKPTLTPSSGPQKSPCTTKRFPLNNMILEHFFFNEFILKNGPTFHGNVHSKLQKCIFNATVYSPNSVVQETSIYSKMFPWINHTCILEHVFLSALIFKKRSHVLWQFWPKTNALSSQPSNHQVPACKRAPVQQTCFPWTMLYVFWNISSSASLFLKNGPTFHGNAHSKLQKNIFKATVYSPKFRGARNIHLQQNVPLDQPYMHFGTCVP